MPQKRTVVVNVICLLHLCVNVDPAHFDLDVRVKDALVLISFLLWQLVATDYLSDTQYL